MHRVRYMCTRVHTCTTPVVLVYLYYCSVHTGGTCTRTALFILFSVSTMVLFLRVPSQGKQVGKTHRYVLPYTYLCTSS